MKKDLCVLVPAYNEALVIRNTLEQIVKAGIDPQDIIVINDCSTDATSDISQDCGACVLRNDENLRKTRSIERAMTEFRLSDSYRFVSIIDADTLVDEGYFKSVMGRFEIDPSIAVVCGRPRSIPRNWLTAWRAYEYAFVLTIFKEIQSKFGIITVAPGCASTYRSDVLSKIEWHPDQIIIEDADATPQIHRKGLGRIVYEREAIVYTQDPHTVRGYFGQVDRWYTGLWQSSVVYRIPFGLQKFDFEFLLTMGETLIFSIIVCLLPFFAFVSPKATLLVITFDQLMLLGCIIYFSIREQRFDLLKFFWLFSVPRILNCFAFVGGFWKAVILRKKVEGWFSPSRYEVPMVPFKSEGENQ